MDYWRDTIAEALEDAKLSATPEQINTVASWAEGAHANFGMAHGCDCVPSLRVPEKKAVKKAIVYKDQTGYWVAEDRKTNTKIEGLQKDELSAYKAASRNDYVVT